VPRRTQLQSLPPPVEEEEEDKKTNSNGLRRELGTASTRQRGISSVPPPVPTRTQLQSLPPPVEEEEEDKKPSSMRRAHLHSLQQTPMPAGTICCTVRASS
jgi:hypothetical protein